MSASRVGIFLLCLLTLACAKSIEKQTRDQVRKLGGAELGTDAVTVTNIRESGSRAVADVTVTTAVTLRREGSRWVLEEVRLDDRRWENVDRILAALEEARAQETREKMQRISEGLMRFREAHGTLPQVESFEKLIDQLSPRYLEQVIRVDGWQSPFSYRTLEAHGFELRSPGADRRLGTEDDLLSD